MLSRLKWMLPAALALLIVGTSAAALAADDGGSVSTVVSEVTKAVKRGAPREVVAAVITLLLFLWRRFAGQLVLRKIPNKFYPLVTAALAFLATLPQALLAAKFQAWDFAWNALVISAEATFLWSAAAKFALPKVFGEPTLDQPNG